MMSSGKENMENKMHKVKTAIKNTKKVKEKKKITKQRPMIASISKSKELFDKIKSKKSSKKQSGEIKLCPNGKPMPSLAELEKMFEDSDEDDLSPAISNATQPKTEPEIKPEPEDILSSNSLKKISERVLELISTLPLPDSIMIVDDEQPSPVIPVKKLKSSGIPYIVGCKDRPQILWKSKAVVGRGDTKYGVKTKTQESNDIPEEKVPAMPHYSNSIFNPKSAEIAAMLKEADNEKNISDASSDSNKTESYDFNNSPLYNNSRSFSPLPSTSKDNETILKNDKRFNDSLTICNTAKVSSVINANVDESSNLNDLEIIELPCETIIIDDESITNNHGYKTPQRKIENNSPIFVDDFCSSIIDCDPTTFFQDDDCQIVDVDAVLAENQSIIKKYKKETLVSNVIDVDYVSSEYADQAQPRKRSKKIIMDKSCNIIEEIVTNYFEQSKNNVPQRNYALTSQECTLVNSFVNANKNVISGHTINLDESFRNNENVSLSHTETNIINTQHVQNSDESLILISSSSPNVKSTGKLTGSTNPMVRKRKSKKSTANTETIFAPHQPVTSTPVRNIGDCPICMDNLSSKTIASTICGHIFCMPCVKQAINQNKRCPTCRKIIRKGGYHQIFL